VNDFALTRSMQTVLDTLNARPTTQKEILKKTALQPRTLRFALSRLKAVGLIGELVLSDARVKIYYRKRGEENE
jgi:hypothetical protein